MPAVWVGQRDRGSAALIRAMAFVSLRLGRSVGRALLYPICAYFVAFAPIARRASRAYLTVALGQTPSIRDVFRHIHVHACVLLDRLFIMTTGTRRFQLRLHGLDLIESHTRAKQGCILLGAHFGSFDILRALAEENAAPVKVMMHVDTSRKFNKVLAALNPSFADTIIPLDHPTSLIAAGQFVRQGGMVAILGDRTIGDERTVDAMFFGRPARFPVGPMLLAAILRVPVVLFVGLYEGDGVYGVHFESFADPPPSRADTKNQDAVSQWASRYAARLEHYCRRSPFNWFNFFDFWRR